MPVALPPGKMWVAACTFMVLIVLFSLGPNCSAKPLDECGDASADLKQGTLSVAALNQILSGCGELLQSNPNNPYIYFNIAAAFESGGDQNRALEYYSKAIEIKSDFARAYNDRGNIYNFKGDEERALADQTKSIEIDAGNSKYYRSRSDVYFNTGDFSAAVADMTKAIELSPHEDFLMFYQRGEVYERLGQSEAAITDYQKARALAGGAFPPVIDALKRLGIQIDQ